MVQQMNYSINGIGTNGSIVGKIKLYSYLISCTKINSKQNTFSIVKP